MEIEFPPFDLREYQKPLWNYMLDGGKRAVIVWHRRAGKELICFSMMVLQSLQRVGSYVYFFPSTRLGRRILWDGRTKDGLRFLDIIPKELLQNVNAVEMKVTLKNGSIIQIIGTDQIINVGINPIGCVFSEYSLQTPDCYNFIRPILRENGGWSIFNYTPRGRNHAYEMYLNAKNLDDWFCEKLSVNDTHVLTPEDIDKERAEGMSEELVQQEYYCSFQQGVEGSVYGRYLNKAELDERITDVPHDPDASVHTVWDLGWDDDTVIIYYQLIGQQIHIINLHTDRQLSMHDYALILEEYRQKYGYKYGRHYAPHDIKVTEIGSGFTRWEQAKNAGIFFEIVDNISIQEGIELARGLWGKLWIDQDKCKYFLKCIENYHYGFSEKNKIHSPKPVHDWSSHVCDAFRYMALACRKTSKGRMSEEDAETMQQLWLFKRR